MRESLYRDNAERAKILATRNREWLRRRKAGDSVRTIANSYGVVPSTVRRALRKLQQP